MPRTLCLIAASLALVACDRLPGKPKYEDRWQPPSAVLDFDTLFAHNCRGCHGNGETVAGSITLKNSVYLAVANADTLRNAIANGVANANMPAFSRQKGGPLTDQQIDILVNGLLAWKKPSESPSAPLPRYSAPLGDIAAGQASFGVYCASCHGADGTGAKAGSVVNPNYLANVSNQYLRTITIAGRPELGCPNFAARVEGKPMDDTTVSDIVAWLASHRRNEFGDPIPVSQQTNP